MPSMKPRLEATSVVGHVARRSGFVGDISVMRQCEMIGVNSFLADGTVLLAIGGSDCRIERIWFGDWRWTAL